VTKTVTRTLSLRSGHFVTRDSKGLSFRIPVRGDKVPESTRWRMKGRNLGQDQIPASGRAFRLGRYAAGSRDLIKVSYEVY